MAKKTQKVDVWERLSFDCPECSETSDIPGWVERGDKVQCPSCSAVLVVQDQFRNGRPADIKEPVRGNK